MREDLVSVRAKDGNPIAFAAGQKYGLKLAEGEVADHWHNGDPITRGEFEDVLGPDGLFEIVEWSGAPKAPAKESEA